MKNCFNCRRPLEGDSGIQCHKCKQNEEKYGAPSCCKYCQLPAAFVDNLCVHCTYLKRKLGSPVPCSKCALRCAFAKEEKISTALCRLCSMNMTEEEKIKFKRSHKSSSSTNLISKKPRKSLSETSNGAKSSDFDSKVQEYRDQIAELKTTIMERDQTIMQKDKIILLLRTDLKAKEKGYLDSLKQINRRNETIKDLKDKISDLKKDLDYYSQKYKSR
uniref:Protein FAM76A n=1 Tax=Panagrolaimus sp. JU765 TaxID=591449 RepID=A0AC34RDB1_9BILA